MLVLASYAVDAQVISEAINYSNHNYYGTARSMSLGNAVTAIGGDLGTIGINPAGSVVSSYGQFVISSGLVFSSNHSGYSTHYEEDYLHEAHNTTRKVILPNLGFTVKFESSHPAIQSMTFGFVCNTTSNYLDSFSGYGTNMYSSMLGSFAASSGLYDPSSLNNYDNFYNSSIPWNSLLAYQSGMIAEAVDADGNLIRGEDGSYTYVGTSELITNLGDGKYDIRLAGPVNQYSRVKKSGGMNDMVFNFALKLYDNLYLGANFGVSRGTYRYEEFFRESSVTPSDFPIEYADGTVAHFDMAEYSFSQYSELSGVYGKIGAIWTPIKGLRLGASVQTPTFFTIKDRWELSGSTSFIESNYDVPTVGSPQNRYSYDFVSPGSLDLGVAFTFGDLGLVSVDYEFSDYGAMRFYSLDGFGDSQYFGAENSTMKNFTGVQNSLRLGAEVKLGSYFALRAGYSIKDDPVLTRYDENGYQYDASTYYAYYNDFASNRNSLTSKKKRSSDNVSTISAGLGYSSNGSFFLDFAVRRTIYSTSYFNPYSDYLSNDGTYLPEIRCKHHLTDAVLTLGWRF